MITCTDSSVRLVGRWYIAEGRAFTTTPGAHFWMAFSGQYAILHFSTKWMAPPYPHLWISIDGGPQMEVPVDRALRIHTQHSGNHIIHVIFKSANEQAHRWYAPLEGRIEFCGYEADAPGILPSPSKKTIEFVGDSITEGVLVDAPVEDIEWTSRPFQDDATATYAWLTAQALDLEPLIMGYGGVGIWQRGSGSVPRAAEAYPYCFHNAPISYPSPDYILINHGTNDQNRCSPEAFREGYLDLLRIIRAHHPQSRIFILSPFCGAFANVLQEIAESSRGEFTFISTTGWISGRIHPTRESHCLLADKLTAVLKEYGI